MEELNDELHFKKKLFGSEIEIIVYTPNEKAIKELVSDLVEEVYEEALRLQKIFNVFDSESEISKLNEKRKMKVSKELVEVLKKTIEFSKLTKGKYDVTLGRVISQRKKGLRAEKVESTYKDIQINSKTGEVTLNNKDAMLDLGSIAKGYITDRISEMLKEKGLKEFLINSRGDLNISGDDFHVIGIQHPREKGKNILFLSLMNEAVATSGDYNQFHETFEESHIINQNNIISVTVVAKTLEEADVYATALFVANEEEREKLLKNKKIKVLLIDKELNIKMFNNFKELLIKT